MAEIVIDILKPRAESEPAGSWGAGRASDLHVESDAETEPDFGWVGDEGALSNVSGGLSETGSGSASSAGLGLGAKIGFGLAVAGALWWLLKGKGKK